MNKFKQPKKGKEFSIRLSSFFLSMTLLIVLIAWITERRNWQAQKSELLMSILESEQDSFDEVSVNGFITFVRGIVQTYADIGPNCELSTEQEQVRSIRLVDAIKHLASMEEVAVTKVLLDEDGIPHGLNSQHTMMYATAWDAIYLLEKTSGKETADFSDLRPSNVEDFIRRVKLHQNLVGLINSNYSKVSEFKGLGFFEKYLKDNEQELDSRHDDYEPGHFYERSWEHLWNKDDQDKSKLPAVEQKKGSGALSENDTVKTESKSLK